MTAQQTPGPYTIQPAFNRRHVFLISEITGAPVAQVYHQSDAQLLAAAPALLASLKFAAARVALANNEGDAILSAWLSDSLAAIANATKYGETGAHTAPPDVRAVARETLAALKQVAAALAILREPCDGRTKEDGPQLVQRGPRPDQKSGGRKPMTAPDITDSAAALDGAEAKASRAKTFHISPAEEDGYGKWYEIFVRGPASRAALVGADPDDFEFGDRADDPSCVLVHYDATNDKLDPSFGYVEGSNAHETERAIFHEFKNDLLEEAREDERLRTAPVAEILVEADAVIEAAQAFLTEDRQF